MKYFVVDCFHHRTKLEIIFRNWQENLWGYHERTKLAISCYWNAIWKQIQKNLCSPFDSFHHTSFPFLSPYFRGLFHCISCPSFFTSHHFSLTVSSNPSPGRWCPWKGGPLLNQWLLWSLAISSPSRQSIIPFLYFPSHLLTRLISSSSSHLLYFSP